MQEIIRKIKDTILSRCADNSLVLVVLYAYIVVLSSC